MKASDILREVATERGLTVSAIRSRKRDRPLVEARTHFVQRCAAERSLSDGQIGRVIERTAHTVRYHRIEEYRERKKALNRTRHARIGAGATR